MKKEIIIHVLFISFLLIGCKGETNGENVLKSINARGENTVIDINTVKRFDINNDNTFKLVVPSDIMQSKKENFSELISSVEFVKLETIC